MNKINKFQFANGNGVATLDYESCNLDVLMLLKSGEILVSSMNSRNPYEYETFTIEPQSEYYEEYLDKYNASVQACID